MSLPCLKFPWLLALHMNSSTSCWPLLPSLTYSLPLLPCLDNSGLLLVSQQAKLFPTSGPLHILFLLLRSLSPPFMIGSTSVFSINLNATERPSPTILPWWDLNSTPTTITLCHNSLVISFITIIRSLCASLWREISTKGGRTCLSCSSLCSQCLAHSWPSEAYFLN